MAVRRSLSQDQQNAFNNALQTGISRKDTEMIKLALDKGADPDILLFAAIDYKRTMGDRFQTIGHTPRAISEWMNGYGGLKERFNQIEHREGVEAQRLEWMEIAKGSGANLNAERKGGGDNNWSAAHCLHDNFDKGLMDYMLQHGVAIDAKDPNGDTLLMRAVREGDAERAAYYLEMGADPMKPCGDTFPLQRLQSSDKFGKKEKAALLKDMMEHVKMAQAPAPQSYYSAPRPAPPPELVRTPEPASPKDIEAPAAASFKLKDDPPPKPSRQNIAI